MIVLLLLACFGEGGPCTDYCDYICDCHQGEADFNCDECYTVFASADAQQQDECEASLADQRAEDDSSGHVCTSDTGP